MSSVGATTVAGRSVGPVAPQWTVDYFFEAPTANCVWTDDYSCTPTTNCQKTV